ncbi:MAG: hypothetical protein ACR2QE_12205 [Acidimicrobiales bacterium]
MIGGRWSRWAAPLITLLLAAAACGADSETTDTDLGSTGIDPTVATSTATSTSGAPATSTGGEAGEPLLGQLIDTVPDPGVHPLMAGAFAALNDATEACGNLPIWTEHMTVAVTRFENLVRRVQASPELAPWRGTADARALSDQIRDRLVLQDRCTSGAVSASDQQLRNATSITGRAVAVADWYQVRLYDVPTSVGAEMWYHADHLGHVIEIERVLRAAGALDIVVVGTGQMKSGVDPLLLSETTGSTVMNASMPLLYPTVMSPWLEQLRRRGRAPSRVVIGVGAADGFRGCTENRITKMDRAVQLQNQAFATLPVLADIDRERVLVGPGQSTYEDSPVLRSHRATTVPESQGTGVTGSEPDPELGAADRTQYEGFLTDPVRCAQIITSLGDVVAELVGDGVEVLVVGMPIHPDVRSIPPGGSFFLDAVTAEQATLTEEAGGRFLDLSALLSAGEFVDLTDATVSGRERVTRAISDALES